MIRTRVGYAGGTTPSPTYHNLGDHSETIEIDFDPGVISYERLIKIFWNSHSPAAPVWSRQYRSVVFFRNEDQKRTALKTMKEYEKKTGRPALTQIEEFRKFYYAENYHQKYYLRQMAPLAREFNAIYPELQDFVHSTAVARVNGYAGGYGDSRDLMKELDFLGLSEAGKQYLGKLAGGGFFSGPACAY